MKKFGIIAIAILIANILALSLAFAGDKLLEAKALTATEAVGKSGPYVRIIVEEDRDLNGVKYKATVPVMVFNAKDLPRAKALKPGDGFKAVVTQSDYQGRTTYTLQSFVQ